MSDYGEMHERLTQRLQEIKRQRSDIKEQYIQAWLAAVIPDEHMNVGWLIEHVELVETISADTLSTSWYLRMKPTQGNYEARNYGPTHGAGSGFSNRVQSPSEVADEQGGRGHTERRHERSAGAHQADAFRPEGQ